MSQKKNPHYLRYSTYEEKRQIRLPVPVKHLVSIAVAAIVAIAFAVVAQGHHVVGVPADGVGRLAAGRQGHHARLAGQAGAELGAPEVAAGTAQRG